MGSSSPVTTNPPPLLSTPLAGPCPPRRGGAPPQMTPSPAAPLARATSLPRATSLSRVAPLPPTTRAAAHPTSGTNGEQERVLVLALERTDLAHLARALGRYDAELRRDALRLTSALVDLRATALAEAREGVRGPPSPDLDVVSHSADVVPLTLSYDRAADALDVSKTTFKRLVRAGRLPVVEVEGVPRVRVADLEEYVAHLEPRPAADDNGSATAPSVSQTVEGGGPPPAPPAPGPRGPGAASGSNAPMRFSEAPDRA